MTSAKPGRYVKRPVVVEAIQYDGSLLSALDILDWIGDATSAERSADGNLVIHTLEGDKTADWGDYVIRGVQGEFYPCKPGIFNATYQPAPPRGRKRRRRRGCGGRRRTTPVQEA